MGNWHDIHSEVRIAGSVQDVTRRNYLKALHRRTGRNTIVYYSAWLQKGSLLPAEFRPHFAINDLDKNGFMSAIHKLDRSKGLDLILHTPGGDMAATESLIQYLRSMFGTDIRAIVPQIAMSGGTMIACAAKEILMGLHSNIGPFDPQIGGVAAQAILEEFQRAGNEMASDPKKAFLWQPIIQKIGPGMISACQNAIAAADDVVRSNLMSGMFAGDPDAAAKAQRVIDALGSHAATKMHNRHIEKKQAKDMGLVIVDLESDAKLQDAVLSVHHACMITFEQGSAYKFIENHEGAAFVASAEIGRQ